MLRMAGDEGVIDADHPMHFGHERVVEPEFEPAGAIRMVIKQ